MPARILSSAGTKHGSKAADPGSAKKPLILDLGAMCLAENKVKGKVHKLASSRATRSKKKLAEPNVYVTLDHPAFQTFHWMFWAFELACQLWTFADSERCPSKFNPLSIAAVTQLDPEWWTFQIEWLMMAMQFIFMVSQYRFKTNGWGKTAQVASLYNTIACCCRGIRIICLMLLVKDNPIIFVVSALFIFMEFMFLTVLIFEADKWSPSMNTAEYLIMKSGFSLRCGWAFYLFFHDILGYLVASDADSEVKGAMFYTAVFSYPTFQLFMLLAPIANSKTDPMVSFPFLWAINGMLFHTEVPWHKIALVCSLVLTESLLIYHWVLRWPKDPYKNEDEEGRSAGSRSLDESSGAEDARDAAASDTEGSSEAEDSIEDSKFQGVLRTQDVRALIKAARRV